MVGGRWWEARPQLLYVVLPLTSPVFDVLVARKETNFVRRIVFLQNGEACHIDGNGVDVRAVGLLHLYLAAISTQGEWG